MQPTTFTDNDVFHVFWEKERRKQKSDNVLLPRWQPITFSRQRPAEKIIRNTNELSCKAGATRRGKKVTDVTLKRNIPKPEKTRYPHWKGSSSALCKHLLSKQRCVTNSQSRSSVRPRTRRQPRVPIQAMHRHTVVHHSYTWSRADGQLEQASLHTRTNIQQKKHTRRPEVQETSQPFIEDTDMQCIHRNDPQ